MSGDARRRGVRLPAMRVSTVLVMVAMIPVIGAGLIIWSEIADARVAVEAGDETERLADVAHRLSTVDDALFEEMTWSGVVDVGEAMELTPAFIGAFIGADPVARRQQAVANTDAALSRIEVPGVDAELADARDVGLDLRDRLDRFQIVIDTVHTRLDGVLAELEAGAGGVGGDARLSESTRALRLSGEIRNSVADGFFGYFATLFDIRSRPATEIIGLAEMRAQYDAALSELIGLCGDDPDLHPTVLSIASDPRLQGFLGAIDDEILASVEAGAPAAGLELSAESVITEGLAVERVFGAATDSAELTSDLVEMFSTSVVEAAGDVRDAARGDILRAYAIAAAMLIAALVASVLAARFIVRPLSELRRAADMLRIDHEADVVVGGPSEVRAAAAALEDAAAHLRLVTIQAEALAAGDLTSPALESKAPGGLGWALQKSVRTLRGALSRQEDLRRRLAHEASHDGLTELANRSASIEQLSAALERAADTGTQVGVLFIDLDRFKDVNDRHGHGVGDRVLASIARRMCAELRAGDRVGRLGGDEFVIIAEPVDGEADALALAERVLASITEPISISDAVADVGASIGVALSEPGLTSAERLLHLADLAAYSVKEQGRGGIRLCDDELRAQTAKIADLSEALRRAIDCDELVVHFQPIVGAHDRAVKRLEALVRWQRDGATLLQPSDFISIAERGSLIVDVDCWVIDAVARQVARWCEQPHPSQLRVAVNLSGRHLAHPDVVEHVLAPLRRHGVEPSCLVIEVTESAVLDDLAGCAMKLQELRDAGVMVSIDDFGIGHTSLSSLRALPIDVLKIDRSFTVAAARRADDASIVRSVIETGHALGAEVTAEGIEDESMADALTALGADSLQGFHLGRPRTVDGSTLDEMIDAGRPTAAPVAT